MIYKNQYILRRYKNPETPQKNIYQRKIIQAQHDRIPKLWNMSNQ